MISTRFFSSVSAIWMIIRLISGNVLDAEPAPILEAAPSEDPFADNFSAFAGVFGIEVRKEKVTPLLNGGRAFWLELMAALGPMAIRILLEKTEPRIPRRQAPEPETAEPELDNALRRKEQGDEQRRLHDIFVADNLETHNGAFMMTSEPWKLWQAFCWARGEHPGNQRSFTQRLGKNFRYDRNNNRPRFLHVRAKQKTPAVRLAVSNRAARKRTGP
jgi:hypothetical protein